VLDSIIEFLETPLCVLVKYMYTNTELQMSINWARWSFGGNELSA